MLEEYATCGPCLFSLCLCFAWQKPADAHRELRERVQTRQEDIAKDNNAPTDGRLGLCELHVKLVDVLRAIAAHLSALIAVLFLRWVGKVHRFSAVRLEALAGVTVTQK